MYPLVLIYMSNNPCGDADNQQERSASGGNPQRLYVEPSFNSCTKLGRYSPNFMAT